MQGSPHWKETKLSLERPYKNDEGHPLPTLLDITVEGELIYEPKEPPTKVLGDNLRRIFLERGADFFEKQPNGFLESGILSSQTTSNERELESKSKDEDKEDDETTVKPMTVEELFKMRSEIMPHLYVALGEMTTARDLLAQVLSSSPASSSSMAIPGLTQAEQPKPIMSNTIPNTLSATIVDKPPAITPLQAFNAQLVIGGKDEALRKAAGLFKGAAERMESGRLRSERYWVDALKIRRANWGLIPAPLPFGAPTGKGADRTTKDFVISYGLEESSPIFRRRAIAQMSYTDNESNGLSFQHRQNTRLRISVSSETSNGLRTQASNTSSTSNQNHSDLNDVLRTAQLEVIEQEIYAHIAKEAGSLPSASARVSERLILIDAALDTELKFQLVDTYESDVLAEEQDPLSQAKCDFIYHYLLALLLRKHAYHKKRRLGMNGLSQSTAGGDPPILQPVIDLLQYQVFCRRIRAELDNVCSTLSKAGVPTTLRFNAVEEIGKQLIKIASEHTIQPISGEATIRVDGRYTIQLTMASPSSLTVHLSQATISILSIPELGKLLLDEVEKIVLERICSLGRQTSNDVGGVWFVDMNRCVGRWDGGALTLQVAGNERFELGCVASRFGRQSTKASTVDTYDANSTISILDWAQDVIRHSLMEE